MVVALGVLLIVGGTFFGLVPGIPGFVLALAGAALISNESRRVARALDRTEVWLRKRF